MTVPLLVLAGVLAVGLAIAIVLWRMSAARAARAEAARRRAERDRLDAELALAEQTARLEVVREQHELVLVDLRSLVVQADGVRAAAGSDASVVARGAAALLDSARAVVTRLRRTVVLERRGEAAAQPLPRLADLSAILDAFRDGIDIEFRESGERRALAIEAELALLRIVEEALENARRHAGAGARVVVRLRWTPEAVELLVDDDGDLAASRRNDPAAPQRQHRSDLAALTDVPAGRGMTAMRERAELAGGMLAVRRRPGLGFSVALTLPVRSAELPTRAAAMEGVA